MNNKEIVTPQKAEKIQNEIYRKMSADQKIKIAGQLFLLGKKLNDPGTTSLPNRKSFKKT